MRLDDLKQWLLWIYNDKGAKVPVTRFLDPSGSNHVNDFTTRSEAEASPKFPVSQGLAFCFVSGGGLVGIDLDDCITDGRAAIPWCLPILERFRHTYMELSPSLSGVKIYCQGELPEGVKTSVEVDGGAVEMWSHGRFFAFTDLHLDGTGDGAEDCQEAIDWLIEEYGFKLETKPASNGVYLPARSNGQTFGTLESRMTFFAAACEPVAQGNRNLALYRACCGLWDFDHHGEIPTDELMHSLALSINARYMPPMEAEEVAGIVEKAHKHRQSRPPKVAREFIPEIDASVDISALKVHAAVESPPKKPNERQRVVETPFPKDALKAPGFVATFVDWCVRTAIYPQPQLAVAGAVSLLAALTGRKIAGEDGQLRTNLYMLGVAPAGSGKEHIRRCVKLLLEAADRPQYSGPERLVSHAGLIKVVTKQRSVLLLIDEIGKLLATMQDQRNAHLYNIGTVMLQLYSASDTTWVGDAYADEKKVPRINQPNLCLFGTTAGASLWNKLSLDNVSDGLLPRMGLVEGDYVDPVKAEKIDVPGELVMAVHAWDALGAGNLDGVNPDPVLVSHTSEARERQFCHMVAIAKRRKAEDEYRAAIWSRTAERTAKLALIFAASRVPGAAGLEVELADVDRAVELSNWMTRRLIERVAGYHVYATNQTEKDLLRVLEVIRKHGPISKRDITRRTQSLRQRERNDILFSLIESGDIVASTEWIEAGNGKKNPVEIFDLG